MQAVILAGGLNSKCMSLYGNCLKPMLPFFDKPIIDHLVSWASTQNITEIVIVLSQKSTQIAEYLGDGSRYGVTIKYIVEERALGTAGSLKNISSILNDTFVVVPSDIITDIDLISPIELHKQKLASVTLITTISKEAAEYGIVGLNNRNQVVQFAEKPKISELFSDIINTGIYIMSKETLISVPNMPYSDLVFDLFPRLINNNELFAICADGYWCDVADAFAYKNAHFDALEGKLSIRIETDNLGKGIWMGKNVSINPNVTICPPAYFGDDVKIDADVHFAGKSIIGSNCIINKNAYIFNSIIGHNSMIGSTTRITNAVLGGPFNLKEHQRISGEIITSHTEYAIPMLDRPKVDIEEVIPITESITSIESKTLSDVLLQML